jgi:hypothetical protein
MTNANLMAHIGLGKYTMRLARKRFRSEINPGPSFRAWARRTYNSFGCAGKLARITRPSTELRPARAATPTDGGGR